VELRGAVVVVTGASAGIGEATALRFARAGSRLVLAARRLERLEALSDRIGLRGGQAIPIRCDVTASGDIADLVERTDEAFGRCDVLVNNAGIPGGGPFGELSQEHVDRVVDVNLLGVLRTTKALLPTLLEQGSGHIVNVASLAGRFATPGAAVYTATKHAVIAFSEALNYEVEDRGVLVTAVNPGLVSTEGFPQGHVDPRLVLPVERVAEAIVRVVRRGIAPEYSVPRWVSSLQAFRVLTPPLYRWGVRRLRRAGLRTIRDGDRRHRER
jgi:NADP-dependent 3-hydroxy acid dehydrogenase YdfG